MIFTIKDSKLFKNIIQTAYGVCPLYMRFELINNELVACQKTHNGAIQIQFPVIDVDSSGHKVFELYLKNFIPILRSIQATERICFHVDETMIEMTLLKRNYKYTYINPIPCTDIIKPDHSPLGFIIGKYQIKSKVLNDIFKTLKSIHHGEVEIGILDGKLVFRAGNIVIEKTIDFQGDIPLETYYIDLIHMGAEILDMEFGENGFSIGFNDMLKIFYY